jgi:N-acetylglutamate synthase-like GNAT family acetyltransferase
MSDIEIITYSDRHQPEFKALNAEWLELYNLMETHDMEILDDPEKHILAEGGVIYLAKSGEQIVGSAALIKESNGIYELAKMAVSTKFRKQGISTLLLQQCIAHARALNAQKITLFSNHQLTSALALYEKFGFQYIPLKNSPFLTADIKMELVLL